MDDDMNDDIPIYTDGLARTLRFEFGLLTEDDLTSMLGLKSVTTLATWRGQRIGPAHTKLGRSVFYRKVDVQDWIRQRADSMALEAACAA